MCSILLLAACAPDVHIYYSVDGTPHVIHDIRTEWDAPPVTQTAWYNAGMGGLGIWGEAVLWGRLGELAGAIGG